MRDFTFIVDEPTDLGGSDSAPNPVELVLAALGSCLTIGYVLNATLMGIQLEKVDIATEGDIDIPGFFGLQSDVLPGFTNIRVRIFIKAAAPRDKLEELHQRVISTSPVGLTLAREVKIEHELVKRRTV